LSRDGQVKPEAIHADLWREVGWDPAKQELPPPELLRQLSMGYDLEGNKLTQGRGLFRQPKEGLITLPAELSQSLKDYPEIARDVLRAVVAAHVAEVEREAVRVRVGGGLWEWYEARTLIFIYMCRITESTDLTIRDCYQLRELLLGGKYTAYTVGGSSYQGLDLLSSVGVWDVNETKWTGLTNPNHTDHLHCNWAKKATKFDPNDTQEN
jgi:hypothetical protein